MIPIRKKGKFEQPRTASASTAAAKTVEKSTGKKRKSSAVGPIIVVCALVLIGLAAGGVYFWGSNLQQQPTIFPNVCLAGVNVGGMTPEQALEAVDQAVTATYAAETLEVQLPDRTLTFDPTQTNVALDAEEAVDKAMAYGREGGAFRTVLDYVNAKSEPVNIDLTTTLNLDTAYIRSIIDEAAADVERPLQPTKVSYDQRSSRLNIEMGVPAMWLEADALYDAVCQAYSTGNMASMTWDYAQQAPESVDLQTYYDSFCKEPEDAYYDAENHTIVDDVPGLTFDLDAVQKKLDQADEGSSLTVQLREVPAELSAETLYNQMFGTKLESRSSYYWKWQTNRTRNLELACEGINGTIVNPGEVFSFNEILGERTEEKGYMPATVFGGEGNIAAGGGICQVASTIFYAALYLDLETVMRYPHSYSVDYVPLGMDAAIYWDDGQDYRFRNNREHPILIEANTDNDHVNITFWGVKENDNYVVMTFEVLESWTDEDEEIINEDKPAGYREVIQTPYTGMRVEAYQSVFDGTGKLIKTKTYFSYYYSRPKIWEVSPDMATPDLGEEPDDPIDDPIDDPLFGGG